MKIITINFAVLLVVILFTLANVLLKIIAAPVLLTMGLLMDFCQMSFPKRAIIASCVGIGAGYFFF